jgi:hypothetical protein
VARLDRLDETAALLPSSSRRRQEGHGASVALFTVLIAHMVVRARTGRSEFSTDPVAVLIADFDNAPATRPSIGRSSRW